MVVWVVVMVMGVHQAIHRKIRLAGINIRIITETGNFTSISTEYSTVYYSSTVQYITVVQYKIVQYSTVQYRMI